jgi:Transposase IS4
MAVRRAYWRMHELGRFISRDRFESIHRFFSLNNENTHPSPSKAPWFYKIQRISDLIRAACRNSYVPFSYIAINEAIMAFKDRSEHTVKLKNKSIDTG